MDPILGSIILWPFDWAPQGWAFCEGQVLPITQNTGLFSLMGTSYGGDGKTTFALPKLNAVTPAGAAGQVRYIIALQGIYPSRP